MTNLDLFSQAPTTPEHWRQAAHRARPGTDELNHLARVRWLKAERRHATRSWTPTASITLAIHLILAEGR